ILGIIPLDLHIQAQTTKARWRIRHLLRNTGDGVGNLPKHLGHRFSCDKIINEAYLSEGSDYIKGTRIWIGNYKLDNRDKIIYTDGSKDEQGNTGAGWASLGGYGNSSINDILE
ncbi:Uncharacterized protein FKW44_008145, partial [Caligus rogercresseyi]